jgi:hypothetical protein
LACGLVVVINNPFRGQTKIVGMKPPQAVTSASP